MPTSTVIPDTSNRILELNLAATSAPIREYMVAPEAVDCGNSHGYAVASPRGSLTTGILFNGYFRQSINLPGILYYCPVLDMARDCCWHPGDYGVVQGHCHEAACIARHHD